MLKTPTFLTVFAVFLCFKSSAQNINNYVFSGAYVPTAFVQLTGAVSPSLTAGDADDGYFNGIPIGFDFFFMGVRYTNLSASTNGWISLGADITNSQPANNLTIGTPKPILAPLWDNLHLQTATNFSYLIAGATGSRTITLQWLNVRWSSASSQSTISFQTKLYESTGVVEFIYRPESGSLSGNESASIGIAGATGLRSLSGFGESLLIPALYIQPSVSTTEISSIAAKASYQLRFTFSPPDLVASAFLGNPTPSSFSASTTTNSTRINWADNSNNEAAFVIYQSTDNTNFNYIGQTSANTSFFDVTGLTSGITYNYRIYAMTEGRLSSPLTGAVTTACISAGTWTGKTNSNWRTASNWCGGSVPISTTDVIIQAGALHFPIASGVTTTARNIVVQPGASLTVTGHMQVSGAISNSGTFNVTSGTLTLSGTTTQTIPAGSLSSNTIENLIISNPNGVNLLGTLRLNGTLNVSAGIFATNGFLTLSSSATSSAQVAAIPSTAAISGLVTVERYIQGGTLNPWRTYRMLSSPVYDNTTSLITSGLRTYALGQFLDDMHISGANGTASGFDASPQNAPSAFYYSELGFTPFTATTATTNVGSGVYIFYRGNRTSPGTKLFSPFSNPESHVMNFKGVLNQQDVSVPLNYVTASNGQAGFNLVGNPYAATIDWNSASLGKTNVGSTIWIWNPANRNYATYNGSTGVNGASQFISSGQSFFVKASAAGANITFREGVKVTTQQPPTLLMSSSSAKGSLENGLSIGMVQNIDANSNTPEIRIKMDNPQTYNTDEIAVLLADGESGNYTYNDALHMDGEGVYLSSLSTDGVKLAINKMPGISSFKQANLFVNASLNGNYTMSFLLSNWIDGSKLELVDNFLNQTIEVGHEVVHSFLIDKTNVATFGGGRFVLRFTPPTTLPINDVVFTAREESSQAFLSWTLLETKIGYRYYVEKRVGGGEIELYDYNKIDDLSYILIDKAPTVGTNYYRLAEVSPDGTINYSEWKTVKIKNLSQSGFTLAPNPTNNFFKVNYNSLQEGVKYRLRITNLLGQKLKELVISGEDLSQEFFDVTSFQAGVYVVSLFKDGDNATLSSAKLIKN